MSVSTPTRPALTGACLAVAGPAAAAVTSQEDLLRVMGGHLRQQDGGELTWFLVVGVAAVAALTFLARWYNRRQVRSARHRDPPAQRSFGQLAGSLGFRRLEITNLRRIIRRLSGGDDPVSLLSTSSGRRYLAADLRKRVRRREREVAVLERMLDRLETAAERGFHERDSVRLEVDIMVWLVKKVPGESPVEDDIVVDIIPVSGRLRDLSEGGASVCADVPLAAGDLVEMWSADTQIWLPPLLAGVVGIEEEEGEVHVHVHFLNPPLSDVRKAIQEVQRLEREEVEPQAEGRRSDR